MCLSNTHRRILTFCAGLLCCAGIIYLDQYLCTPDPTPQIHPPAAFLEAVKLDAKRSSHWAALRKKIIAAHPYCAYCGSKQNLQAHHIRPFHLHPELELDPKNVIVLCETPGTDHHLHIGHAGNFKSENPNVVEDCAKNRSMMEFAGTWPADAK